LQQANLCQDYGIGFPVSEPITKHMRSNHFGLAGMQEPGDAVGGVFSASSEPGKGTTIHVTIPLIDHHLEERH
jgi:signal transduction histidine kinase